jgi:hypothetical protein
VLDDDTLGNITFRGHDGTDFATSGSVDIRAIAEGSHSPTARGGRLDFFTTAEGTNTKAERMTIADDGNVGIGTTAPAEELHMIANSGNTTLFLDNGSAGYSNINLKNNLAGGTTFGIYSGFPTADDFTIRENGVESRLSIKKTTGNVGIGTESPDKKLSVSSSEAAPIRIHSQGKTPGDKIRILFSADNSIDSMKTYAAPGAIIEDASSGSEDGSFVIDTTTSGTPSEKVRVTSDGNVGIGSTDPDAKLDVAGDLKLGEAGACVDAGDKGRVRYNTTSDELEFCNGDDWQSTARGGGAQSLTGNGYATLPGGLIIQWGETGSVASNAIAAVSFPITFPTAVFSVVATQNDGNNTSASADNVTTSGFDARNDWHGSVAGSAATLSWIAVGH